MHILKYNTLKTLRTQPNTYDKIQDSYTDSDLTAILLFNEELFQDLIGINPVAPEDEKIKKALGDYIDYVRAVLHNYGSITEPQMEGAITCIMKAMDVPATAAKEIISGYSEYISANLVDKKQFISKEKYEEIQQYKKMLSQFFPISYKPVEQPQKSGKLYRSADGIFNLITLAQDLHQHTVNVEGSRKGIYIQGDIHWILVNTKHKVLTIRQLLLVEDVTKFRQIYKKDRLDLSVGLNLLSLEYGFEVKDFKVNYSIVACDKKHCCIFTHKKETLDSIKKQIRKETDLAGYTLFIGDYSVPAEFKKEYFI